MIFWIDRHLRIQVAGTGAICRVTRFISERSRSEGPPRALESKPTGLRDDVYASTWRWPLSLSNLEFSKLGWGALITPAPPPSETRVDTWITSRKSSLMDAVENKSSDISNFALFCYESRSSCHLRPDLWALSSFFFEEQSSKKSKDTRLYEIICQIARIDNIWRYKIQTLIQPGSSKNN